VTEFEGGREKFLLGAENAFRNRPQDEEAVRSRSWNRISETS